MQNDFGDTMLHTFILFYLHRATIFINMFKLYESGWNFVQLEREALFGFLQHFCFGILI